MATTRVTMISMNMARSMAPTLRGARPAFYSRRRLTADQILGMRWGCKPKTAKCLRLTLGTKLADVVEVMHELGESERLAQAVAPVEEALARTGDPCAIAAVLNSAALDGAEDPLAAAFLANPCAQTARPLALAKSLEALAHTQAAAALRREYSL